MLIEYVLIREATTLHVFHTNVAIGLEDSLQTSTCCLTTGPVAYDVIVDALSVLLKIKAVRSSQSDFILVISRGFGYRCDNSLESS